MEIFLRVIIHSEYASTSQKKVEKDFFSVMIFLFFAVVLIEYIVICMKTQCLVLVRSVSILSQYFSASDDKSQQTRGAHSHLTMTNTGM